MPGEQASRDAITGAVLDHLLTEGRLDESLRTTAAAIGVSHSLLLYHYGSRDSLLSAVADACEERNRHHLVSLRVRSQDPRRLLRAMWRHLADPVMWPVYRLSFSLRAAGAAPPREEQRSAWVAELSEVARGLGVPPRRARTEALMWVALFEGLMLQLVTDADPRAIDRAAEALFRHYDA